jgi:uroporphyrinogen-III decarboxylase
MVALFTSNGCRKANPATIIGKNMTRRQRLAATFRGLPVDRPAVCFNEINGLDENPQDHQPFNIFTDPSWLPLIELAREKTDRIVLRGVAFKEYIPDPVDQFAVIKNEQRNQSILSTKTITIGHKIFTARTRRDSDLNTLWTLEHFIKSVEDLQVFLQLPIDTLQGTPDVSPIITAEEQINDTGMVMVDTPDPICLAAGLFDMELFTIIALTEPVLFHRLLEKFAAFLYPMTRSTATQLPGRAWRIYGPEYASPPFLSPELFQDYVVRYDKPMIEIIHVANGFVRLHSHGRLKAILNHIISMGSDGLDPIEPPPQGDMELSEVAGKCGRQLVLFGNLELSDIENLPTALFKAKIERALREGTNKEGRGFVLMPSACPIGRKLKALTLANYKMMVEMVESMEHPRIP